MSVPKRRWLPAEIIIRMIKGLEIMRMIRRDHCSLDDPAAGERGPFR